MQTENTSASSPLHWKRIPFGVYSTGMSLDMHLYVYTRKTPWLQLSCQTPSKVCDLLPKKIQISKPLIGSPKGRILFKDGFQQIIHPPVPCACSGLLASTLKWALKKKYESSGHDQKYWHSDNVPLLQENGSNTKALVFIFICFVCIQHNTKKLRKKVMPDKISHTTQKWLGRVLGTLSNC